MKTFLLILVLIPLTAISQPEGIFGFEFERGLNEISIDSRRQYESNPLVIENDPVLTLSPIAIIKKDNKMLLDSFHLVYNDPKTGNSQLIKEYYNYNENGNRILLTTYAPEEIQFTSTRKIESAYDKNNHCISEIYSQWNYASKQWEKTRQAVDTYDMKGLLIKSSEDGWTKDGQKESSSETIISYDMRGNILLQTSALYGPDTVQRIFYTKWEYAYDNDKCISTINYEWNKEMNLWINKTKAESEYDTRGNEIMYVVNDWDTITKQWIARTKRVNTYSPIGKINSFTNFRWEPANNRWIETMKFDYSFDDKGYLTSRFIYHWDFAANQWIDDVKAEFSYDARGNEILSLYNRQSKRGSSTTKTEDIYNDKGLLVSRIFTNSGGMGNTKYDFEYDDSGNMTMRKTSHSAVGTNKWDLITKFDFYYSHPTPFNK